MPVAVRELAQQLHIARLERAPTTPLTGRIPDFDLPTAYAVQDAGLALRLDAGETIVGGKLGFTSRAMREAMGVDQPNSGWLTDAMLVDDGVADLERFIHPKVEPEIAFLLVRDLEPPVQAAEVLAATGAVLPCLEVVDSRFVDFRFGPLDNIADDSSAGCVVLGDPVACRSELDLALVGCAVWVDGHLHATAAGAAVLEHPAAAVAWMANHARRPLRAGHLVLSGGLTAPVDLVPGTVIRTDVDRLGSVQLRAA
jgi:2-oxo-3-hexenedioate decarboxylase